MMSSGMLRRVALVRTDVSEEPNAAFIRVTRICELGTILAATSEGRTLRRNIFFAACVGIVRFRTKGHGVVCYEVNSERNEIHQRKLQCNGKTATTPFFFHSLIYSIFLSFLPSFIHPFSDPFIHSPIFLQGLCNNTGNLSEDSQCTDRYCK
jgi:hypothetical protein